MAYHSKGEFKMALRDQAKRKVNPSTRFDSTSRNSFRDNVEQGLRELKRTASEGGDSAAKKAKNELTYLLNNYLPQYDTRIEALIDTWRRSGDPTYDPAIRNRLRKARQDHMNRSNSV